jgi:hypothetical protein
LSGNLVIAPFGIVGRVGFGFRFGSFGGGLRWCSVLEWRLDAVASLKTADLVLRLQHDVGFECLANLSLQFEDRQLKQAYGLLQLRGHGELLTES